MSIHDELPQPSPFATFMRMLCWTLVIVLAYAGQRSFTLQHGKQLPLVGVVLQLGAISLLGVLLLRTHPRFQATRLNRWLDAHITYVINEPWRSTCGLVAIGCCLIATVLGEVPQRGWYALGAWLMSIVCGLLAARDCAPVHRKWTWSRAQLVEAGLVLTCMLLALLIRTVDLPTIPAIITGDEGSIGLEARDILSGRHNLLFVTGWTGMPRISFLLMALPMKIWGQGILGLRMHAALTGTATILTLYWLIRSESSMWLAQCSIWLLATYPFHIHTSRLGLNNADDSLIMTLTFAAMLWGVRTRNSLGWALAGLCAALSLYVYPGARLTIILAVGFVGVLALPTRGRWLVQHRRGLLIATLMFLLTGLPIMRYYASHWSDFNTRVDDVGIIQSGWLAREARQSGRSPLAIIGSQFLRTFFAYGFYGDSSGFYGDPAGLLQFWPAVLFPLGLAMSLFYVRRPLFLLLVLWFFAVVILGGTLTQSPPYSSRLSSLAPVYTTMIALALITLAQLGHHLALWERRAAVEATVLLVVALGASGVRYYFVEYIPSYWFGDRNAELATEAGTQLNQLPTNVRAYFLGMPRMFYNFSTIHFLAPQIQGSDAPPKLTGLPPDFDQHRPAFFFCIPEREIELRQIQQQLPGGRWIEVKRAVDHAPLLYTYEVDRVD